MPFINAEPFLGIVSYYRLLWVLGKFGGHKTSVCYQIARPYLERGYRLITNNTSIWADDLNKIRLDEHGHLKAIVILDEGGLEFRSNRQIQEIAAYANKMDIIFMVPSFFPPARQFQVLTLQPLFSLKSAGLPVVVYQWRTRMAGFEDKGNFLWIDPSEIYGIYSRQDPGARTAKIVDFLIARKEDYRRIYGHTEAEDQVPGVEENTPSEFDLLSDAVEGMAEAADRMASIPIRIRGRRRV